MKSLLCNMGFIFEKLTPADGYEAIRNLIIAMFLFLIGNPIEMPIIGAIFILILLDWATGIFLAIKTRNLKSSIGFKGIIKIFIYMFLLIIAKQLEFCHSNVAYITEIFIFFAFFLRVNILFAELTSVIENLNLIAIYYEVFNGSNNFLIPILKVIKNEQADIKKILKILQEKKGKPNNDCLGK